METKGESKRKNQKERIKEEESSLVSIGWKDGLHPFNTKPDRSQMNEEGWEWRHFVGHEFSLTGRKNLSSSFFLFFSLLLLIECIDLKGNKMILMLSFLQVWSYRITCRRYRGSDRHTFRPLSSLISSSHSLLFFPLSFSFFSLPLRWIFTQSLSFFF